MFYTFCGEGTFLQKYFCIFQVFGLHLPGPVFWIVVSHCFYIPGVDYVRSPLLFLLGWPPVSHAFLMQLSF